MNYNDLTRRYFEAAGLESMGLESAGMKPAGPEAAVRGTGGNVGELAGPGVFRGAAGSVAHGTWVQFDLQMKGGVVAGARFLAFGCPHTIAVSSWLAEQAVGRRLLPQLPESVPALRDRFAVPVEKMGRLLIIEDAWLAAARPAIDYSDDAHILT
jgi:hypothetical protein